MMTFLINYWWILIIFFIIGFISGDYILNFLKLPSTTQINKIKEWLLWAVAAAEKELGRGTGQLKLRYVYSMFTQTWSGLAQVISFEAFSALVDEALVRFTKIMQTNKKALAYIQGDKDGSQ